MTNANNFLGYEKGMNYVEFYQPSAENRISLIIIKKWV